MTSGGPLASFRFRSCLGAFIEIPTEIARDILPGDLHPVELHHGAAVLSAMAFDFHDTPFGDYREIVLGVAVAPRVAPGGSMPRSAFFPFAAASTSAEARAFAAAHLHLPYHDGTLEIEMAREGDGGHAIVRDGGAPVVELHITEHEWRPVDHLYQAIMRDADGMWTADLRIIAEFSENEEERGSLALHPHRLCAPLPVDDLSTTPFREQWMREGSQTFQQLRRVTQPTGA